MTPLNPAPMTTTLMGLCSSIENSPSGNASTFGEASFNDWAATGGRENEPPTMFEVQLKTVVCSEQWEMQLSSMRGRADVYIQPGSSHRT